MGNITYRNVFISGKTIASRIQSDPPVADFTGTPVGGDFPLTVSFTDASTNSPTSWAWDFTNDGTTDSTSQNPTYTYSTAGTYTVKLTATNDSGSGSITKTNYITVTVPVPVADFNISSMSGTAPLTVNFTDASTNSPTSWAWDFTNDGTTDSTSQNPSYTYNTAGTYSVKLTATNEGGSGSTIKPNLITVTQPTYDSAYSVYFDGTGDGLTIPATAILDLTGDFTIEFYTYATAAGVNWVISNGSQSGSACWYFNMNTTTGVATYAMAITSWPGLTLTSPANTVRAHTWTHVAITRSGSSFKMFINGTSVASSTNAGSLINTGRALQIGYFVESTGTRYHTGYISNLRIVKGTAVYTANFTPSTTALTAITGTSLLTCQGASIVDNSGNNLAITVVGDAIRSNYSSLMPATDYWSAYLDGVGDYQTVPDSEAFNFGTGNFTVEAWVNPQGTGQRWIASQWGTSGASDTNSCWYIFINASNQFSGGVAYGNSTTQVALTDTNTVLNNTWYHLALVRNGNIVSLYVNGRSVASSTAIGTSTVNNSNLTILVGARQGLTSYYTGYVSNFRIVKGTAVYTSNFTTPAAPLTAIANTSLLTFQGMDLKDKSANNFTVTASGDAKTVPTSLISYNDGYYSNYFDGTGDYLTIPASSEFYLATGDFTIEAWIYKTVTGKYCIVSQTQNTGSPYAGWNVHIDASEKLNFEGSNGAVIKSTSVTVPQNTWVHIAIVKSSSTMTLYQDGVSVVSGTMPNTVNYLTNLSIGNFSSYVASVGWNGYISNLRIVKGTALYTANFTPSTTSLTAVAGTSLLTCQSYGYKDNSSNNFTITRNGDTAIKSVNPFNSDYKLTPQTWSTWFDGSGDYLTASSWSPVLSDFTVEAWINMSSTSTGGILCGSSNGDFISVGPTGISLGWYSSTNYPAYNTTLAKNTWHHIEVSRQSGVIYVFVNGQQVSLSSGSNTATALFRGALRVGTYYTATGSFFNGYISNLRIKNVASHTSNFTVPTSPLTVDANTKFLACQTAFHETLAVSNPTPITATGNVTPRPVSPFTV
jgi:PKD repeat protein